MKRYLAFFGENWEARGGFGDFLGQFDTLEEAIAACTEMADKKSPWTSQWAHVFDCTEFRQAWENPDVFRNIKR